MFDRVLIIRLCDVIIWSSYQNSNEQSLQQFNSLWNMPIKNNAIRRTNILYTLNIKINTFWSQTVTSSLLHSMTVEWSKLYLILKWGTVFPGISVPGVYLISKQ